MSIATHHHFSTLPFNSAVKLIAKLLFCRRIVGTDQVGLNVGVIIQADCWLCVVAEISGREQLGCHYMLQKEGEMKCVENAEMQRKASLNAWKHEKQQIKPRKMLHFECTKICRCFIILELSLFVCCTFKLKYVYQVPNRIKRLNINRIHVKMLKQKLRPLLSLLFGKSQTIHRKKDKKKL